MLLRALNDGSVTSTGTMTVTRKTLGGVLITADGANNATVIVRKDDASGKQVFKLVTKSPVFIIAPIDLEGTATAYYDVTGTGAAAQFFEWLSDAFVYQNG